MSQCSCSNINSSVITATSKLTVPIGEHLLNPTTRTLCPSLGALAYEPSTDALYYGNTQLWNLVGAGAIGPTGLQGSTGSTGLGSTGMGTTGNTGIGGLQGNTGSTGLGSTGSQGSTGMDGIGSTGLGSTGSQGSTGENGIGSTGATGSVGLGSTGSQGSTGENGIGNTGATGSVGLGSTGSQGGTGSIGLQGNTGSVGPTGPLAIGPSIPSNLFLYVSETGNDVTGDGTIGNPYQTIERALDDARLYGWDSTAEIRMLSTGGVFTWPTNLDMNSGTRGRQASPLVLRGYNTNPNPGRTTVFSDAVVSATFDPVTGIVDVVGTGPFSSAQIGQYLRFTSGGYSTYPFLIVALGTFAVDVLIVAVPNATTLRLAFSNIPLNGPSLPLAGDTFVVESIDTSITMNNFSTLSGNQYIAFKNLIFNSATAIGGLIIETSTFFVTHAVNIVLVSGNFILSGYDGCTIMGGANEFYSYDAVGFAPTTQSLFIDSRNGFLLTTIEGGSQNADILLANACFIGPANIVASGFIEASYFVANAVFAVNNNIEVGYSWFNTSSIGASRGSSLSLPNVRVTDGSLSLSNTSHGWFGNFAIDGEGIFVTDNSRLSGNSLNMAGSPADSSRISVGGGSVLSISGDLIIPPADIDGISLSGSSTMIIIGDLTSSSHGVGRHGALITGGSKLVVSGNNAAFDSNGGSGLFLLTGSSFIGGSVSASNNSVFGIHNEDSNITATGSFTINNNGSVGFDFYKGMANLVGNVTLTSNVGINLRLLRSALTMTETLASTGGGGVFHGISLEIGSKLITNILNIDLSGDIGLNITDGSSIIATDMTVTNSASTIAGVYLTNDSSLVSSTLTSNTNAGSGVSSIGSNLNITTLTCGTNASDGMTLDQQSKVLLCGAATMANNVGNGITIIAHSSITHSDTGTNITCDNNQIGVMLSKRSSGYLVNLVSTVPNIVNGVECRFGSKLQVDGTLTMTGANDVLVGVNAVTTWANIITQNPAFTTDYLSGQNPTQLCEVTI